jgi:hypothetical protein
MAKNTAVEGRVDALAKAVIRALQLGNGRSNRCRVDREPPDRLAQDGVTYDPVDLDEALMKLVDCG